MLFLKIGFPVWQPPAPLGMFAAASNIHWPSVKHGFQPACALSFLYLIRYVTSGYLPDRGLIAVVCLLFCQKVLSVLTPRCWVRQRCALHSAALLKNVPNLARNVKVTKTDLDPESINSNINPRKKTRMEMFSEMVDIEEVMSNVAGIQKATTTMEVERAKPTSWTLQGVMIQYGIAQIVSAVVGSFGIIPSVATSPAMFSLKAERVAPQFCSVLLLSAFYLTDFRLVAYVPKMAFSCLVRAFC